MSEPQTEKTFDPAVHMLALPGKGGPKDYLPVAARVVWFRESCPIESGWAIRTEMIDGGWEKGFAVFRTEIVNPAGLVVATGTNAEDKAGFVDFLMKAETGSIGRALASCGFGTMAALDEGEVVDAPVKRSQAPAATNGNGKHAACACIKCGQVLTPGQTALSTKNFGQALCPDHQKAIFS